MKSNPYSHRRIKENQTCNRKRGEIWGEVNAPREFCSARLAKKPVVVPLRGLNVDGPPINWARKGAACFATQCTRSFLHIYAPRNTI